jgi:hypothetical protein
MRARPDDETEVTVDLSPTLQPGSIDPAVLRRAMKFGQKAQTRFRDQPFRTVETELRVGWQLRGESTEWEWVRAAVRAGYEQEPQDEV